jgi:hypothetical protein
MVFLPGSPDLMLSSSAVVGRAWPSIRNTKKNQSVTGGGHSMKVNQRILCPPPKRNTKGKTAKMKTDRKERETQAQALSISFHVFPFATPLSFLLCISIALER